MNADADADAAIRWCRLVRPVRSLGAAVGFYRDALGLGIDEAATAGRSVVLQAGEQRLELTQAAADVAASGIDDGATDVRFQHIALITFDMVAAVARLRAHAPALVTVSQGGPQALAGAAVGITAFKFRDPDGHPVELLSFATSVLPSAWQAFAASRPLGVVGLDHCALSVSDAERSIRFYREVLGLRLSARQINEGPAQARLDGLPAACVEVIALSPRQATPHVELLGYRGVSRHDLAPRSALADTLVLEVGEAVLRRARAFAGAADGSLGLEIEDPDGHRLRLVPPGVLRGPGRTARDGRRDDGPAASGISFPRPGSAGR